MGAFIDITGAKFGRLEVLSRAENLGGLAAWLCRCECGSTVKVRSQDLRRGKSNSCGCLKIEQLNDRSRHHGMVGTRPYRIWKNMKTRCLNSRTKTYADYGGRGIRICDRWLNSFENFWADMGPSYSPELSIDRKEVDGNYCPENCRWADKKTQNRNTRANHFVDSPLGRMTLAELAEKSNINYSTLKRRVYRGVTNENLLLPSRSG